MSAIWLIVSYAWHDVEVQGWLLMAPPAERSRSSPIAGIHGHETPRDSYWLNLKDQARKRGGGKCEYCQWRPGYALHHRTYEREGCEQLEDVMLVCNSCHDHIHGFGYDEDEYYLFGVKDQSLAAQGDVGFNHQRYLINGRLYVDHYWKAYLLFGS